MLRYELAKTSWSSSKDMDTADWRRNNNQLETESAEERGVDIVESRRNGPQLSTRHDDDDDE